MLYPQIHFQIAKISDEQIIIEPEHQFNPETGKFDKEPLVTLTGKNFMIARGGEVGHLTIGNHLKRLTTENLKNIVVRDSDFQGQVIGFGSAIKGDQKVEVALNQAAIDLSQKFRFTSQDVQDLGKMENVNPVTRSGGYYKWHGKVLVVEPGTKVRVNGVTFGCTDGDGFAVGMSFKAVIPSIFGRSYMPPNVLSHLKGGTEEHVVELTTGLKKRSAALRSGLAYYDTMSGAYVRLKQGNQEVLAELFSNQHSLNSFSALLKQSADDGILDEVRTRVFVNSPTFLDKAVKSLSKLRFRGGMTGCQPGFSRVMISCYDIYLNQVGLSDSDGEKFVGCRQPVISARNVFALISKRIWLPKHVSQYRAQLRKNGKLQATIKGIVSEVSQAEVLINGKWVAITEPTLIVGKKDISIGQAESDEYDIELCVVNRWKDVAAMNPDWVNQDASIDFDGDNLQLHRALHILKTWGLVQQNYEAAGISHKKVAKVKRPWTEFWEDDFLSHLTFAAECEMMMGTFNMVIELLTMFEGDAQNRVANELRPEYSGEELMVECRLGYQVALDARKRVALSPTADQPDFEYYLTMSRQMQARFNRVDWGHIKKDPGKYVDGWFAVCEPTEYQISQAYDPDVRSDYLPLMCLKAAMTKNKYGTFTNWNKMSQTHDLPSSSQDVLAAMLPSPEWAPSKDVQNEVFLMIQTITQQERRVKQSGYKVKDGRNREILQHDMLSFIEQKRNKEIKAMVHQLADMLDVPEDAAREHLCLACIYIDYSRRSPRDNRDFAARYLQPEIFERLRLNR